MESNMRALDDEYKKKVAAKKAAMKKAFLKKQQAKKAPKSTKLKKMAAPKTKKTKNSNRFVSKGKILHPFDPKRRKVLLAHPTTKGIQNIADVISASLKKHPAAHKKKAVAYAPLKTDKMKATLVGTAAQKANAKAAAKEINVKAVHNAQKATSRNVKAAQRLKGRLHHAMRRAQAEKDWHSANKQAKRDWRNEIHAGKKLNAAKKALNDEGAKEKAKVEEEFQSAFAHWDDFMDMDGFDED